MDNPLFEEWRAPFGAPPLDRVKPEHFPPAYARALAEHDAEIAAIAAAPASFEATITGLEKSGRLLAKVDEYSESHRAFGLPDDLLNILKDDLEQEAAVGFTDS